jgi:anti-sigma factor RsiW
MLTCADVVRLITDYTEGRLSPVERRRFEEHVAICPPCRAFLDQMRTTIVLVGELREEDVPPAMEEHLLDAFRDWTRDGDA